MASVVSIRCAATISFDEAQPIVRGSSVPLGTQFVPIGAAGRQTLARDMVALIDSRAGAAQRWTGMRRVPTTLHKRSSSFGWLAKAAPVAHLSSRCPSA